MTSASRLVGRWTRTHRIIRAPLSWPGRPPGKPACHGLSDLVHRHRQLREQQQCGDPNQPLQHLIMMMICVLFVTTMLHVTHSENGPLPTTCICCSARSRRCPADPSGSHLLATHGRHLCQHLGQQLNWLRRQCRLRSDMIVWVSAPL